MDITQQAVQLAERFLVQSTVIFQTIADAAAQLVEGPAGPAYADDRHVERPSFDHRLKRWEDLFVGEVASRAEENEGVGMRFVHRGRSGI